MPFAEVNGTRLYYETIGKGPPVMVMHGGLGSDHTFYPQIFKPLHNYYTFIYYDMREHGKSFRTETPDFTYEQLADDADGLRKYLGFEKICLIGHSAGGWIAQVYANKYQQNLASLVLYHTGVEDPANYQEEAKALIQETYKRSPHYHERAQKALKGFKVHSDEDFKKQLFYINYLYFYKYDEAMDELVKSSFEQLHVSLKAYLRDVQVRPEFNSRPYLPKITVPTLIITGRYDFIIPVSQAELLDSLLPNSQLVIFEESAHFTGIEEPEKFGTTLQQFLGTSNFD